MQENSNLDIAERTYANLEVYRALLGSLILFINKGAIGNFNRFERMFIGVFKIRSSMPDLERVDVLRELVLKGYPWEIASGEYLNKLEETLIAANFHLREVLYDDCRDSQGYNGEDYEEGDAMLMARQACAAGIICQKKGYKQFMRTKNGFFGCNFPYVKPNRFFFPFSRLITFFLA